MEEFENQENIKRKREISGQNGSVGISPHSLLCETWCQFKQCLKPEVSWSHDLLVINIKKLQLGWCYSYYQQEFNNISGLELMYMLKLHLTSSLATRIHTLNSMNCCIVVAWLLRGYFKRNKNRWFKDNNPYPTIGIAVRSPFSFTLLMLFQWQFQ